MRSKETTSKIIEGSWKGRYAFWKRYVAFGKYKWGIILEVRPRNPRASQLSVR